MNLSDRPNNSLFWTPSVSTDGTIDYSGIDMKSGNFESIDVKEYLHFMRNKWYYAVITIILYVGGILLMQNWMKNRKPVKLKWLLVLWNSSIGVFSIMGFSRTFPSLRKVVMGYPDGFYRSMCIVEPSYEPEFGYWVCLFAASKFVELGDTMFILLRKKPLELAQWYHHVVTLLFAWLLPPYVEPSMLYTVVVNFGVHSLMYPYFAMKVAGFPLPAVITKIVSTAQFAQMLILLLVGSLSGFYYLTGIRQCYRNPFSLACYTCVIISFVWIFGNIFRSKVMKKSTVEKRD